MIFLYLIVYRFLTNLKEMLLFKSFYVKLAEAVLLYENSLEHLDRCWVFFGIEVVDVLQFRENISGEKIMKPRSEYEQAHLVVAAIRLLEYQKNSPPNVEEVSRMLQFSIEQTERIVRKLVQSQAVDRAEGAYGTRLFIRDHLAVEALSRTEGESGLEKEIKKFQENRKPISQKIESIQAEQREKKKNLFAELEKKLKGGADKPAAEGK